MEKDNSLRESIAESLLEHELRCPDFLAYIARPKCAEKVETVSDLSPDGGEGTAIVLHGAMVYDDHFTRDTIRIYLKHYPKASIILSTWEDETRAYLDDLRESRVTVHTTPKPEDPGVDPGEFLRIPAHAGVTESAKQGVAYVWMTRTDQRMYAPNLIAFFLSLMQSFPLEEGIDQRGRLMAGSYGSRLFHPFCISSMMMFGYLPDVQRYWSATPETNARQPSAGEGATASFAQKRAYLDCHLASRFLCPRSGMDVHQALFAYWQALAKRFCLVDKDTVDLYWLEKPGDALQAQDRRGRCYEPNPQRMVLFRDWLILYAYRHGLEPLIRSFAGGDADPIRWEGAPRAEAVGGRESPA